MDGIRNVHQLNKSWSSEARTVMNTSIREAKNEEKKKKMTFICTFM
jgi:hypothetical protein